MQLSSRDQRAASVEAWMKEMEQTGHLPGPHQLYEQQLPAYTAIDAVQFTQPIWQTCCAFQKLNAINRGTNSYYELLEKSPQFRFISWVMLVRTPDHTIPEQERLRCPMIWCRATFQENQYVQLINHLSACPRLAQAEYVCPYHHRNEYFAEPELPQRPRSSKKRFLKNTFEAIVRLGTKKRRQSNVQSETIHAEKQAAEMSSEQRRAYSAQKPRDVTSAQPLTPELGTSNPLVPRTELEGQGITKDHHREKLPSEAKRRSQAAELPGSVYSLFEMEGQLPSEFQYDRAELSDKRFSYNSQSSEEFTLDSPSPISPTSQLWYSTRDFDSPISPSGSAVSEPWSVVSESQQQRSCATSNLAEGPSISNPSYRQTQSQTTNNTKTSNQQQEIRGSGIGSSSSSSNIISGRINSEQLLSPSVAQSPSGGSGGIGSSDWQQMGSKSPRLVPSIRVDTSCSSGKSVSSGSSPGGPVGSPAPSETANDPKSRHNHQAVLPPREGNYNTNNNNNSATATLAGVPGGAQHQSLGTVPSPLQIEADSRDPKKLIQELRGLFNTLFKLTVAKIYHSPPTTAGQAILRSHISAATVFDCGLKGLHLLLRGQIPQQFWQVFGISLLAYACGLATQETDLTKQFGDIFTDLLNWSQAIYDASDRQGYVLLVQQLWTPTEHLFQPVVSDPWTYSSDTFDNVDMTQAGISLANNLPNDSWHMGGVALSNINQLSMLQKEFQDSQQLLSTLNNGAAVQLCKQLLDRYEYLSSNSGNNNFDQLGLQGFGGQPSMMAGADQNVFVIRTHILDPLTLTPGLEGFRPVVNNISMLIESVPNISLRHLELMLMQEGKTASKSQSLYKRFAEAVRRLSDSAAGSMGMAINRSSCYANDIESIVALHTNLLMESHAPNLDIPINQSSTRAQKAPMSYSPSSEADSSVSHRPFSWQDSPSSESPMTTESSMFVSSNNSESFFPSSDPTLLSYNSPSFVPALNDDSMSGAGPSRGSPFQNSAMPNVTSQPRATPPASDSAEGTMTCKICGKVLAGKAVWLPSNMKRHMRELHTPAAKRLVCDVPGCGRAFLRNHNLAHHKKTVHGRGS